MVSDKSDAKSHDPREPVTNERVFVAHGQRLGEHVGLGPATSVTTKLLQTGFFAATRLSYPHPNFGETRPLPKEDAFIVSLQFRPAQTNELWLAGQPQRTSPGHPGEISLYDLNTEPSALIRDPFDSLLMYLPRRTLDAVSEELQAGSVTELRIPPGTSVRDRVVAHLGASVVPLLDRTMVAPELLVVDHLATALCVHLVKTYGATKPVPDGPAAFSHPQVARAKELLRAHLDGSLTLEQLARECGLSRSHFSRAFKRSTGQTTRAWIAEQRVAASQDLLRDPALPLSEVARLCGFADQSHFTRVFSKAVGMGPGAWRRARRVSHPMA